MQIFVREFLDGRPSREQSATIGNLLINTKSIHNTHETEHREAAMKSGMGTCVI